MTRLSTRNVMSPAWQAAILAATTILVLFARRPDQFLHPFIWVEEGKYVLRDYLNSDIWVLTKPLVGYSQLASKIIAYLAFKTSILWAPEIALVLVVMFTGAVAVAVALSPTHLRWPFLCAITMLLIPTDAEVFAVSAYAFWWAGILLLVAVMWDSNRDHDWLRWVYIVLGGLSSPIIGSVTVLLALRVLIERRRSEVYAFVLAALTASVQFYILLTQHVPLSTSTLGFPTLKLVVQQYLGGFFYGQGNMFVGLTVLAFLVAAAWYARDRLDRYFFLLVFTFLLISASVSLRMPIEAFAVLNQFTVGPRYFFYSFVLLSWIIIWVAAISSTPVRIGFGAAYIAALLIAGPALSRRHDDVNWREHVLACARSDTYELPFHYIGHADEMWHATFTGAECRKLLSESLF